jgi:hypothetical protein
MDCANNAWVMVNRGGHVICLDMADGTLRWRAEGRRRYDSYNTQVWMNETATLVVSFGSRTVMAFDTVSGKRLVEPIVGVRAADVGITPGGLVVIQQGYEIRAYERSPAQEPMWTRSFEPTRPPRMLAVTDEALVIGRDESDGDIAEVLSFADGRTVLSAPCRPIVGQRANLAAARLLDQRLVLICWAEAGGNYLLSAQAVDLASHQTQWTMPISPILPAGFWMTQLWFCRNAMLIGIRDPDEGYGFIVSLADGRVLRDANGSPVPAIGGISGPPAIMDRGILVPTQEGLRVYAHSNE